MSLELLGRQPDSTHRIPDPARVKEVPRPSVICEGVSKIDGSKIDTTRRPAGKP
jgi:hypothetical protein